MSAILASSTPLEAKAPPPVDVQGQLSRAIERARSAASRTGRTPMQAILESHPGEERGLVQQLGQLFAMPVIDTMEMQAAAPCFDRLPLVQAMQRCCVLLREGAEVFAVVADPFDGDLQAWLTSRVDGPLALRIALHSDIQAYLSKQELSIRTVDSIVGESTGDEARAAEVLSFASVSDAASPAVKLVNSTLYDALKLAASDIHLECTPAGLAVKYRIDGVLDLARAIAGRELAEQTISRLKVLAELDISERRLPQDGSFRVESNGRDVDLRVSVIPGIHGEDAVIRILDKRAMIEAHGALSLETLGFGLMLINLVAYLFHPGGLGLRSGGAVAVIFSLLCIVIAAMNLVMDFDMVERGIRQGADQKFAWYAAFGLTVTLIWLYLEILRLLSYLRD